MRKSLSAKVFAVFNYLGFLIFSITCVYPFFFIFLSSISLNTRGKRQYFLPLEGVTFSSYKTVFQQPLLANSVVNSLLRVAIGTSLTLFVCTLMAYVVTKNELPLRKFFYRLTVVSMYLSPGIIPVYITFRTLGLTDNFLVYVLPGALSAYYVILIKTYIESIDPCVEESAAMDGCTYPRFFLQFIFPLSKPILAAVAVFVSVGQWNSWYDNFIFVNNPKLQTLQYLCYKLLSTADSMSKRAMAGERITDIQFANITPESIRMTISVLTILPVMMFYPMLQKNFVKGIMLGAVKG